MRQVRILGMLSRFREGSVAFAFPQTRSGRSTAFVLRNGATALATSLLLLASGSAIAKATFTTFDVNGATGTYARGINAGGRRPAMTRILAATLTGSAARLTEQAIPAIPR